MTRPDAVRREMAAALTRPERPFETDLAKMRKSRRQTRLLLHHGTLKRPTICDRCGREPKPAKDGRSLIQAHHHDYDCPDDIIWLCVRCHREITPVSGTGGPRRYGVSNGQSKLTNEQVRHIRESTLTDRALAKRYGVAYSTIWAARRGKLWTHVK